MSNQLLVIASVSNYKQLACQAVTEVSAFSLGDALMSIRTHGLAAAGTPVAERMFHPRHGLALSSASFGFARRTSRVPVTLRIRTTVGMGLGRSRKPPAPDQNFLILGSLTEASVRLVDARARAQETREYLRRLRSSPAVNDGASAEITKVGKSND